MATAKNLKIGNMQFKNVSFAVLPDDQPPMSNVSMAHRGIVGLPVLSPLVLFDGTQMAASSSGKNQRPLSQNSRISSLMQATM
jgi:hypothetical protein